MKVSVAGVGVRIARTTLLSDVDLEVASGSVVGVLGPNGSGKSTLLRTVYRSLQPTTGAVWIDHDDLRALRPRTAARRIAVVTQDSSGDFELSVLDVVLMGRTPHKRGLAADTSADRDLARASLARVDAGHLEDRSIATLSGGERQRVLLARALTQAAPVLILDEPTNHLDIAHQLELLSLVRELPVTAVVALHDLNLGVAYCDAVAVLDHGRVVAAGPPTEALTTEVVRDVFGVRADLLSHPRTGRPLLVFSELG